MCRLAQVAEAGNSRRAFVLLGSVFAINLIAACAHKTGARGINDSKIQAVNGPWTGRISLMIQSNPPQSFFASFELSGQADSGELTLTNPLGSIVGLIKWSPLSARLESAQTPKQFASVDELLAQTTGAAIPIAALFDWLAGKQTHPEGWTADLSEYGAGRIQATRQAPEPQAQLKLIFDR